MFSRRNWILTSLAASTIGFDSIAAHAQIVTAIAANTPPNLWTTQAFCLSAVYKGLATANPAKAPWQTSNQVQKNFLTSYERAMSDLAVTGQNTHAIATSDNKALEQFFAQHGFPGMNISIQGKAVGAVFDVNVAWPTPGEQTTVRSNAAGGEHTYYRAAQMSEGVTAYQVNGSKYPLFKLKTNQPGWHVYLIEAEYVPGHAANLPAVANVLLARHRAKHETFSRLTFPVVGWQGDMDISFLKGMQVPGFSIDEAIGKAKLHLDEKCGHASSGVALVSRGGPAPDMYEINRPFYVMFHKDGAVFPAFVAIANPDSWTKSAE